MSDGVTQPFLIPMGDQLVSPASRWFPTLNAPAPLSLALGHFYIDHYQDGLYAAHAITLTARMARSVVKRRAEYLAGRLCARSALAAQSICGTPHSVPDSRCPHWPDNTCGAITHSHGVAGAVAGHQSFWKGVGLDVEHWIAPDTAQQLQDAILAPEEKPLLDASPDRFARQLTLIFSAKESLYKALNLLVGRSFYFHDAAITAWGDNTLTLTLSLDLDAHHRKGDHFVLHTRELDEQGMTLIALPN